MVAITMMTTILIMMMMKKQTLVKMKVTNKIIGIN